MPKKDPAKLKAVKVSLPFGIGSAEWEADPTQRRAAWALYVELITRIATQPLDPDHALASEALESLHKLFGVTREILRAAGPDVGATRESVGGISIAVLNKGLRPFLAKWHHEIDDWVSQKPEGTPRHAHERAWPKESQLRGEMERMRQDLERYARALAVIAGVAE